MIYICVPRIIPLLGVDESVRPVWQETPFKQNVTSTISRLHEHPISVLNTI
jgi:hypothetical protein